MFIKIKEYKREVKFVTFLHKEDITTKRHKKRIQVYKKKTEVI